MIESVQQWFLGLGAQYGVDPLVFGLIYVGAIIPFSASIAWLVRRLRARRSIVLPALSAGFWFISAYLYLAVVGRNLPVWVYAFVAVLVVASAVSTVRSVRRKARAST